MGNRTRIGQGGTGTKERSANTISGDAQEPPATPPPGQHGNGSSPGHPREEADLDAYIQWLVDTAPPLTAEQRDTLALLLRHPRRR
jgi:hypothetical protein